jgi:hypothetical protein
VPGVAELSALTLNVVLAVLLAGGVSADKSKLQWTFAGQPAIERCTVLE